MSVAERVRLPRVAWRVWLAVVLLLAGLLAWQGNELRLDRRDDDRRDAAIEIATDQVLDLTTLDADSVGTKLKQMSARTSGSFADELYGITTTFQDIVAERKLEATGSVDAVGVSSFSPDRATLLVASRAEVSEGGAEPVTRTFRMSVDVEWTRGEWKIVGMEFVS